jgi:hypothetical protein
MKRANQESLALLLFLLALVRESFPFLLPQQPSSRRYGWVTTTFKTSRRFQGPPHINSDDDVDFEKYTDELDPQVDQELFAPASNDSSTDIISTSNIIIDDDDDDDNNDGNDDGNDDEESTGVHDDDDDENYAVAETPICRIVTRAGSVIEPSTLPPILYQQPYLLDKLDAYYHAQARKIIQERPYVRYNSNSNSNEQLSTHIDKGAITDDQKTIRVESKNTNHHNISEYGGNKSEPDICVLRQSLEDSGFELLSKRDIDLCESLNAGYLLRLSISPDVKEFDPIISKEFYPERFYNNGTLIKETDGIEDLLFDGRILVYWRGYSQEVTKGRLLLPKIDYLQASLVQRAAARLKNKLDRVESNIFRSIRSRIRLLRRYIHYALMRVKEKLQIKQFARWIESIISDEIKAENQVGISGIDFSKEEENIGIKKRSALNTKKRGLFKLDRYGGARIRSIGSPDETDALDPFTICMTYYDEEDIQSINNRQNTTNSSKAVFENIIYEDVYSNNNAYTCSYDGRQGGSDKELPRMQLLERVGISNLIDLFTSVGRRGLLKKLFAKSELVEPTYEEVVVIWRPLVKQKKKIGPPMIVSEFADMFDIEGFEQPKEEESEHQQGNLEIRLFEQVPMSNLQAVFPKTKLVFRPADAFLFDTISFATLAIVMSSIKFDSYRLDLLALVSFSLWLLRTVFRYSNKLARYDLLVKTFLTSKISQRNAGAFQYLAYEAGSQRAIRAALVHRCMLNAYEKAEHSYLNDSESPYLTKSIFEQSCETEVNQLLNTENEVNLDAKGAIKDLQDLRLLSFSENDDRITMVKDMTSSTETLEEIWMELLDNKEKVSATTTHGPDTDSTTLVEVDIIEDEIELDSDDFFDSMDAIDWQERRKAFTTALDKNTNAGISKAKEFLRNRNERNRTIRDDSRQIEDIE